MAQIYPNAEDNEIEPQKQYSLTSNSSRTQKGKACHVVDGNVQTIKTGQF